VITPVRTARPSIMVGGTDYYSQLAPYLLNFRYVDNCDGEKADDLQFQLADRDRRFINDWRPDPGTIIEAAIMVENWFAPGNSLSLDCGMFWIDSVEFDLPQHTVTVKASSIPTDQRIKGGNETRGWENASLEDVAGQIAGENEMELQYDASYQPKYKRVEQTEESGLSFIQKRASDAKLAIKVARNKIVLFDEAEYEQKGSSFTLVYGDTSSAGAYRMSGGHFVLKVNDTAKKCRLRHSKMDSGMTSEEEFETDDDDVSELDTDVNEDPGSDGGDGGGAMRTEGEGGWEQTGDAAASRYAQAYLRDKNKDKNQAEVDLSIGNPLVAAGMTFDLVGCGQFDGKWFIEAAQHTLAPLYDTKLAIRRCLQGY
jgi:phage protein D